MSPPLHNPAPPSPQRVHSRPPRGITFLQIITGAFILALTAALVATLVSFVAGAMRADRAGQAALAALHYARELAMSTGHQYGVEFCRATAQFRVCEVVGSEFYTVNSPANKTPYIIDFSAQPDLAGITLSAPTDPYRVSYTAHGTTDDVGSVTFFYGAGSRTITISTSGDPQ